MFLFYLLIVFGRKWRRDLEKRKAYPEAELENESGLRKFVGATKRKDRESWKMRRPTDGNLWKMYYQFNLSIHWGTQIIFLIGLINKLLFIGTY